MLVRRRFLQGLATTALVTLASARRGPWLARARAQAATKKRPRYVVQLLLSGGIDGLWTLDPKTPREVARGIHLPYPAGDIVEAKGVRFGPHFGKLAAHVHDIAVVSGIRVATANHLSGVQGHARLKIAAPRRMPSALEILGSHRQGQPMAAVTLGITMGNQQYTPGFFGQPDYYLGGDQGEHIFDQLAALDPSDLETVSRAMATQSRAAARAGKPAVAEHLSQGAAFVRRAATLKPLSVETWEKNYTHQSMAEAMQRTIWLLENDLCSGVYVHLAGFDNWDSHVSNDARQGVLNSVFMKQFDWFMKALKERTNHGGTLAEQTALIASSELGRFPRLNVAKGKDHFPQTPMLCVGPWFNTGNSFGPTGKNTEGLPLDLATGKRKKGGHLLSLDDVGATLMHLCGIDAEVYGYRGKRLDFLLRAS